MNGPFWFDQKIATIPRTHTKNVQNIHLEEIEFKYLVNFYIYKSIQTFK
jgi:hypothetical protein